ncbi:hypothetical protein O181_013969 [Austropuccinia psidii MF-1]|uniref:Uncharacterized protein n=1 Tax=Austropuccinia psidii MF-1 TaxID=1389203 RepID=A0A9Q3BXC9_9BASI|nr:hypothetical protein [Austropuccinia psidii MF-1]
MGMGFFTEYNDSYVEFQVTNKSGVSCKEKLKLNQTGSTKSMTDHLNDLHNLCNPKKQCVSSGTLDKFVQSRHPKKNT